MKRKLAAIFSADVAGYSRLMESDDTFTIEQLVASKALMSARIQAAGGAVVDAPGDNLLARFDSVVDAVRCALEVQEKLAEKNADLPPDRQMAFRIGIHLGDVVTDKGRIYGDGVNVAARLESLAEAGGVCISGSAYDQVRKRLDFGCAFLGRRQVKNISVPVRAYRIWPAPGRDDCRIAPRPRRRRWAAIAFVAAVIAVLAGAGGFWWDRPPEPPPAGTGNRPSIAVFPFENLSDDAAQAYFSAGFSKDLTTDLSRFGELLVIEGKSPEDASEASIDYAAEGRNLNVRYSLAGSVRREKDRIRVNARLVNASDGRHVWAERYDRKLTGLFEVQDDIVESIVRKLAVKIDEAERQRALKKDTDNLDAYDLALRGWHHYHQRNRADNRIAQQHFTEALELDPRYAEAYVGLADCRVRDVTYGFTEFPAMAFEEAEQYVNAALAIDPDHAHAHSTKGYIAMRKGAYELAIDELKQAIVLNPNDWRSYRFLGAVYLYAGHPEEALRLFETSVQFDPYHSPGRFMNLGLAHLLKGQYEEAEKWLQRGIERWPDFLGTHIVMAATYAHMEQMDKAAQEVAEIHRISPFFNAMIYGSAYRNPEHRDKIVSALMKAGLKG